MDINENDPRLTGGNPLPQSPEAEAAVLAAAILSAEVTPELAFKLGKAGAHVLSKDVKRILPLIASADLMRSSIV